MNIKWEKVSEINATIETGVIRIAANREGLLSLAGILFTLAEQVPGSHVHLDEYNSLEYGSSEMIVERV